jgi:hypothetical protein
MLKGYHSKSDVTKAYLQMHLSILLWGATAVLGKSIGLSEGLLVWYRMIITTLSLFTWVLITGKSFRVSRSNFMALAGIGVLLMVHWLFFTGPLNTPTLALRSACFHLPLYLRLCASP